MSSEETRITRGEGDRLQNTPQRINRHSLRQITSVPEAQVSPPLNAAYQISRGDLNVYGAGASSSLESSVSPERQAARRQKFLEELSLFGPRDKIDAQIDAGIAEYDRRTAKKRQMDAPVSTQYDGELDNLAHAAPLAERRINFISSIKADSRLALTVPLEHFQRDIEQARQLEIKPKFIDSTNIQYVTGIINSDVLWAVTSDGDILITRKSVENRLTKSEECIAISHAVLSPERNVIATGEARLIGGFGEYYLANINDESSCYQTNDRCLEIGKEAFRCVNILPLNEALEALAEEKEQARLSSLTQPETLDASKQAKDILNMLTDRNHIERTNAFVELAETLSSTTKDTRNMFNIPIVSSDDSTVAYDARLNRLLVPTDAPPLPTVLSIIKEIDSAKYAWAGARDGREKYAQDAATAIRLIEACRKLEQPMPSDLPLPGGLNLHHLAEECKEMKTTASMRQYIYSKYALEHGFEKLDPPQADTRNYQHYEPRYNEENFELIKVSRWTFFGGVHPTTDRSNLEEELEIAERLGLKPARPGDPDFDRVIERAKGGPLLWVMSMNGEIVVAPRWGNEDEAISHIILTAFKPVLAAGDAFIVPSGDKYILLDIDNQSGNYEPKWKLPYAIKEFSRQGIELNAWYERERS